MIETVTAFMGLISAGVFLAHVFEGVRSRAWTGKDQSPVLTSLRIF